MAMMETKFVVTKIERATNRGAPEGGLLLTGLVHGPTRHDAAEGFDPSELKIVIQSKDGHSPLPIGATLRLILTDEQ